MQQSQDSKQGLHSVSLPVRQRMKHGAMYPQAATAKICTKVRITVAFREGGCGTEDTRCQRFLLLCAVVDFNIIHGHHLCDRKHKFKKQNKTLYVKALYRHLMKALHPLAPTYLTPPGLTQVTPRRLPLLDLLPQLPERSPYAHGWVSSLMYRRR